MALTREQLARRIPPNVRANLGPLELEARINLAEDILAECEHLPENKAKRGRAYVDGLLESISFSAFLKVANVLNLAIEQSGRDDERETYRSQLAELASVQPLLLLQQGGEDLAPILQEIAGEPRQPWHRRLWNWLRRK